MPLTGSMWHIVLVAWGGQGTTCVSHCHVRVCVCVVRVCRPCIGSMQWGGGVDGSLLTRGAGAILRADGLLPVTWRGMYVPQQCMCATAVHHHCACVPQQCVITVHVCHTVCDAASSLRAVPLAVCVAQYYTVCNGNHTNMFTCTALLLYNFSFQTCMHLCLQTVYESYGGWV